MGMPATSWRSGVAAVATIALVCIAMTAVSVSERRVELLDGTLDSQSKFRAVGDVGCLGRKCELTDDASRKDLNTFFGDFLNHGAHAGHHSRSFGLEPHHARLSSKEGMKDLQDFYGKQKSGVTAKVRHFEVLSNSHLDQYGDTNSRADINNFYDTLPGGKRQGVVEQEHKAEEAAKQHQLKALLAAQESHRRMTAQHEATEAQADKDHERFHKEAKQQLALQEAGHEMEAVPSAPRTRASERRAENRYYQELQVEAKEEKAKNALRHEDKAEQKQKHQLSAQDAKDDMNKWYDTLDSKVKKTARVVKAEEEAKSGVEKAKTFQQKPKKLARDSGAAVKTKRITHAEEEKADAAYFKSLDADAHPKKLARDSGAAVKTKHISHAEEERADAAYFKSLDADVHKTKIVRDAEAADRKDRPLTAEEARKELYGAEISAVDKTSTVKKAEAKAKEGFEHMKKVAKTDDSEAKAAVKEVPVAVKDAKLSRKAALEQQDKYFASLDSAVHKSPVVLAAEAAAKAGKQRRSLSAAEARKQLFAN